MHKRGLSSPEALRISLKNRLERIEEKISRNEITEEHDVSEEQAKANAMDEDSVDDISEEEVSCRIDQVSFGSLEALRNEKAELERLIELAKLIDPVHDSKLRRLTDAPNGLLRKALSGDPGHKKLIIFTKYKDTLTYLEREIPRRLKSIVDKEKIITVHGDHNDALRSEKLAAFQKMDTGLLIATDCISEGINLQHMANQIMHYELPWNPNRLEQRNGRVDRYGQKAEKVFIWTLVMNDTLDATIFEVLVSKANKIRVDYGFAPPFFGDDNSIFDMVQELKGIKLSVPQKSLFDFGESGHQKKEETSKINPFDEKVIENIRSESFYGQANVDLSEIRNRLRETEALVGTQEDFRKFVLNGLRQFGCTVAENEDVYETIKIQLSGSLKVTGYKDVIERATFNPKTAIENQGIVHLNIGHPVVKRLFELVKIGFFDDKHESYGRTAVITTSDISMVTGLYYFLVRFSVGTEPVSIIEEIVPLACNLIDKKPLSHDDMQALMSAMPVKASRPIEDYQRHLDLAMTEDIYKEPFEKIISEHMDSIRKDRQVLRDKLRQDSSDQSWLEGIDKIELASSDLIAIRLYEPVPRVV